MPVIPEKHQLEDHVHGALAAQFWSQGIENTRSLTGQACTAPCEPQPLRLHAPSGLSRTQFLVAAHAVRVPVFPGFCNEHGGTVLDRVLLQSGGKRWWGALIGRAKLQRGMQQRRSTTLRRNLADPDNYALAATGRLQLSSSTSLKLTAQVDSLAHLQPLLPQGGRIWQQQQQQQQRGWARMGRNSSLAMQLKQQLEGLDLTADLAVNEPSVEGVRRYATTPLRLAVDLAPSSSSRHGSSSSSSSSRLKGLLFRVGLHGVVAPVEGAAAGDAQQQQQQLQQQQQQQALSVHCQGAVALSGSKAVWEASQKPWQAAAAAAKEQRAKRQKQRQRQLEAAQQAVQEQDQQQQQAQLQGQEIALPLLSPAAVQDSIQESGSRLERLRSELGQLRGRVEAGDLQQLGKKEKGGGLLGGLGKEPGGCWSSFLAGPHFKLGQLRGRVEAGDLQQLGNKQKGGGLLGGLGKEPGGCWSSFLAGPHPRWVVVLLFGFGVCLVCVGPWGADGAELFLHQGSFCTCAKQLSRLWGRVEAGDLQQLGKKGKGGGLLGGLGKEPGGCWSSFLAGPHSKDRCVWNALTLSASQQLVGPVRLRGDWRFALDSKHACPSRVGWLQPGAPLALLRHVAGVTPALVDSAVGVDVVVPGAGGLVRLVGWYSPGRKEGGLELRLM
ncbi:hypothetical protein OEZ85_000902 [Tetradesmus obliquus]|uniref:Uncharacterized protein n=1 Tax=Tetradesmus obliquus TaxID=3088 RepID=A0ABY8UN82_TETOB|nr:hypothetical protein OEZ85_000902 [Tetradesmus obliquus]